MLREQSIQLHSVSILSVYAVISCQTNATRTKYTTPFSWCRNSQLETIFIIIIISNSNIITILSLLLNKTRCKLCPLPHRMFIAHARDYLANVLMLLCNRTTATELHWEVNRTQDKRQRILLCQTPWEVGCRLDFKLAHSTNSLWQKPYQQHGFYDFGMHLCLHSPRKYRHIS